MRRQHGFYIDRENMKKMMVAFFVIFAICFVAVKFNINPMREVGDVVDEVNGVKVYYNGAVGNVSGRNLSIDGYNVGVKYQCVEFVKRYYYERLGHKMPDSFGNARDYFNDDVDDGGFNKARGLLQFKNNGTERPAVEDLVVFGPWIFNRYGHVAIISSVTGSAIEIVQQNPGPFGKSRETYRMVNENGKWRVEGDRLLGWLRIKGANPVAFSR